ncbi:ammonium transporter [Psychroflexus aestuariivivens]|uniref:ammonium transporter n=1 Tax=Psychroflexus aestuariivivens TaxID=1795040 RepID=UPI000FDB1C13|nr:ammonium transporter [Psychroflexus aestuariivivens]
MEDAIFTANNIWMMLCIALVFIMHLGFSLLEIGLTRQKNSINILFKNVFIICSGLILYYIIGFNLMYPGEFNGYLGLNNLGLNLPENGLTSDYANSSYTFWTDFLFQGMFAATAATIVSGAVAERIKISAFIIFSIFYVGLIYPISGSWLWGGGFLSDFGFYDFAGSTLVHSVGGWAALVAVIFLGPRIGKFKNKKSFAIPGHNIPLAAMGVFLLWFGWFGFNGGSVLSGNPAQTSLVLVTTSLAAAAGGIGACISSAVIFKNFDITMFMNGILGGLVGITAGADLMSPTEAMIIGVLSGLIVVVAVKILDNLKIDDPVGAIPVHLFCGIWGTLVVGIFGNMASIEQFCIQLASLAFIGVFCSLSAVIILLPIKMTIGLRVKANYEIEGLDINEHGMDAYADFGLNQH